MKDSNTILVVQGTEGQRDLTCKSLEDMGYHAVGVGSVTEALFILSQGGEGIRMVLTEHKLADYSGYELKVRLEKLPGVRPIPVVFLDKCIRNFIRH